MLVVLLVLLAAALGYLFQHQEIITQKVEEWYESNYTGDLEIGKLSLSSWRQWPEISLGIHHFSLTDTSFPSGAPTLLIDSISADFSFAKILQREITLQRIDIQGGYLHGLTTLTEGSNTHILQPIHPTASDQKKEGFLRVRDDEGLAITINDFDLSQENELKNKRLAGYLQQASIQVILSDTVIIAHTSFATCVEGLGFNLDKGYFLDDTPASGAFHLSYHRQSATIEIPQFPLLLKDQTFLAEACLDTGPGNVFFLSLYNDQTDFQTTKTLLPQHLQNKLARYQIFDPIATATYLRGEFEAGTNPLVQIDFTADDNTVVLDKTVRFNRVRGQGNFVNRISEDPTKAATEDRRNLSLTVETLHSEYLGAQLYFKNSAFKSTPKVPTALDLQLDAKGQLADLNKILGNENFFFVGGTFNTSLAMEGTVNSLADVLKGTQGRLYMQNTKVHYQPAQVTIPLTELDVFLSPEQATVPSIRIPLAENQEIKISGIVKNFSSLVFEDKTDKVESDLEIYSADLNLDHFLALIASLQEDPKTTASQARISEIVKGVYTTFQPRLNVRIDQFLYQKWQGHNIQSQLSFINDHQIKLDSTIVYSGQSQVVINGIFDVPDSSHYLKINMDIAASGNTKDFNKTFSNDTFLFRDGDYQFQGKLNGKVNDWRSLLYATRGHLEVQNTGIFFVPEALNFSVANINLDVAQHDITLNKFQLTLPSGGSLTLSGQVDNFMDILAEKETPLVQSFIRLRASYLDYADFSGLFSSFEKKETPLDTASNDGNQIKKSAQNLYRKFHPELDIQIDSFQHKSNLVTDLRSKVAFQGSSLLQFADMHFEYRGSPVRLNANLSFDQANVTPVNISLFTEYFDLGTLVETYNYFGLSALQSAKKIAGKVSINAKLSGLIDDATGLEPKSLLGAVQFTLHEAELVNFEPIQRVAEKFFRTERFESIRFAPITDTLYITQEVVHIPRMEIQSTAFNLFLEGHINYDDNTNLWISVPWRNFNAWEEGDSIPAKTGYYQSGAKLYVEVIGNHEDGLDYKFRLSKKKLYQHQGIAPLYRPDRQYERQLRKQIRKKKRAVKREKA